MIGILIAVGAAFDGGHHQNHDWLNPGGVVFSYNWVLLPTTYPTYTYPAYYYTAPVVYPTYTYAYNPVVTTMIPGGQPMSMGGQARLTTLPVVGHGHLTMVDSSKFLEDFGHKTFRCKTKSLISPKPRYIYKRAFGGFRAYVFNAIGFVNPKGDGT